MYTLYNIVSRLNRARCLYPCDYVVTIFDFCSVTRVALYAAFTLKTGTKDPKRLVLRIPKD